MGSSGLYQFAGPRFSSLAGNSLGDVACGDQHAGRAALQRVLTRKGFTQLCHGRVIVESFDRPDGKTVAGDRVSDAGACRRAGDQDRAGAADAVLAARDASP